MTFVTIVLSVSAVRHNFRDSVILPARLMGQDCFARCRLSAFVVCRRRLSASSVVVCNAAGRRARGRFDGLYCTAGQYGYVPLGQHLVACQNTDHDRRAYPITQSTMTKRTVLNEHHSENKSLTRNKRQCVYKRVSLCSVYFVK